MQTFGYQFVELLGGAVLHIPGVSNDGVRSQRPAELHGVLERRQRLGAPFLVVDRQHREVRGVHRKCDSPFGGEFTKPFAAPFLPREAVHEGEFERPMTAVDQAIEVRRVFDALGGKL